MMAMTLEEAMNLLRSIDSRLQAIEERLRNIEEIMMEVPLNE